MNKVHTAADDQCAAITTLRNGSPVGAAHRFIKKRRTKSFGPIVFKLSESERLLYGMGGKDDGQLILHREVLLCRILRFSCKVKLADDRTTIEIKRYMALVDQYRNEICYLESELYMRGYAFGRDSSIIMNSVALYFEKG